MWSDCLHWNLCAVAVPLMKACEFSKVIASASNGSYGTSAYGTVGAARHPDCLTAPSTSSVRPIARLGLGVLQLVTRCHASAA